MAVTLGSGQMLRVTLVIDESLEKWIIDQARAAGVEGYICSYCSGKPPHEAFESTAVRHGLVRVELLARPVAADAVLALLHGLQRRRQAVTALMDHVTVCPGEGPAALAEPAGTA